jgi:hypothetical protein
MLARIQTELPTSAEKAWRALLERDTFLFVTKGMLGFQGSDQWPDRFQEGFEIETRLKFFHLIPGWRHSLRIVRIDEKNHELSSEENGWFINRWNHRILIEKITDQRCLYTDEIEIRAGFLTVLIWAYANTFYRYRQSRWRRLAKVL